MIQAIAWRELRTLFLSPLAWYLLGTLQLIIAWLFLVQLEGFQTLQPELVKHDAALGINDLVVAPLFNSAALILLLVTPLLSMRMISEEFRSGTIQLIYSAPITMYQVVLGKYIALMIPFLITTLLVGLMPLSLLLGAQIDLGRLAASLLGLLLLSSSMAAIGLFLSSLTRQPNVAAIATYGVLLLLWIVELAATADKGAIFDWISLASHYRHLLNGMVHSSDLLYYLLLVTAALAMTIHRLDSRRRQG